MQKISNSQQLGEAIRNARMKLKMSQTQLAMAARVGMFCVIEIEAGRPTARLGGLLRVIAALGGELRLEGEVFPRESAAGQSGPARH